MENMENELEYIFKQAGLQMIEKIRFLYRYELQLYDYPETPFIIQP